jgi:4-hydroxybutyrate dehydrogenase
MSTMNYLTAITLAPGAVGTLGAVLADLRISRPLLVSDAGVMATPASIAVTDALPASPCVFADTPPNPTEEAVAQALEAYRAGSCDGIVALGGGSPIDLAKAVALLATHPGPLEQYAAILGGMARITPAVAPVIAIPTTAGTGSEVGRGALITFRDGRKLGIISGYLIPRHAICDPELTLSLPPRLTAATGMDALAHCIETFLSPRFNPVADAIALDGAGRAFRHIEIATRSGSDLGARLEMMTASLMGGLCFQKGLGAVHSLSHALGAIKEPSLHHGTLNAILLPPVLRANRPYAEDKFSRLLLAMGLSPASDLATEIEALNARLGIADKLTALGVRASMLPRAIEGALADHSHPTNPFQPDAAGYASILNAVMD